MAGVHIHIYWMCPASPIFTTHTYRGTSHKNHGFLHPETNVMVWGVTISKFDGQGVTKITANIVVVHWLSEIRLSLGMGNIGKFNRTIRGEVT